LGGFAGRGGGGRPRDVLDLDLDVRIGRPGTRREASLELFEQRAPVRADEADVARLGCERGGRAIEEGALLLVELDADDLRRVHGAVVDDAEPGAGVLRGDLGHWTSPGGADGADRVVVVFGQLRETPFSVGIRVVRSSTDLLDLGVELSGCPLHTLPR